MEQDMRFLAPCSMSTVYAPQNEKLNFLQLRTVEITRRDGQSAPKINTEDAMSLQQVVVLNTIFKHVRANNLYAYLLQEVVSLIQNTFLTAPKDLRNVNRITGNELLHCSGGSLRSISAPLSVVNIIVALPASAPEKQRELYSRPGKWCLLLSLSWFM